MLEFKEQQLPSDISLINAPPSLLRNLLCPRYKQTVKHGSAVAQSSLIDQNFEIG
jgi:hypothetical protein